MKLRLSSRAVRAALFLTLLAGLSLAPEPLKGRMATVGTLHRYSHLAIFFAGFLFLGIGNAPVSGRLAIALAFVGALLEVLQRAVYGNSLEYRDILDDATGVALGFLCLRLAAVISNRLGQPQADL
jgi:hypothetical protein